MSGDKNLSENIFTRINTRKLRERAYKKLLDSRNPATVKVKGGGVYKVDIFERTGKQFSGDIFGADSRFKENGVHNVVLSFDLGPEKFFMQTTADILDANSIKISTLSELFKLQRRKNFRVEIPFNYEGSVFIQTLGDRQVKHDFVVSDLSLGGLSFEIPMDSPVTAEKNDKITGSFQMKEDLLTFDFQAEIRYIAKIGSMGSGIRKVGIEFIPLDTTLENTMLELLIKIQKETVGMLALGE